MTRPYMFCVIGQPEDELLDRRGAQHAAAHGRQRVHAGGDSAEATGNGGWGDGSSAHGGATAQGVAATARQPAGLVATMGQRRDQVRGRSREGEGDKVWGVLDPTTVIVRTNIKHWKVDKLTSIKI